MELYREMTLVSPMYTHRDSLLLTSSPLAILLNSVSLVPPARENTVVFRKLGASSSNNNGPLTI